ncbi:PA0069 family radical SAM protein [Pandoraea sputorum]|uniref:Radical SAM superfamily n=1 Tax=Pandoraea sputorum TaxID=93222 RepID=A0A239SLU5_9BURK|nr:PA0069 family radical SAM protein [Pandoraea sputorum]SNU86202.1 Radical SAM superfamily [Pandoraea sputorum]VVE04112.1 DNA repair photolyase [Pandoraea sputorum]
MASSFAPPPSRKGRGATANLESRFSAFRREIDETRHESDAAQECEVKFVTQVALENARTIISRNTSADIPFDRSINPYRGCEHGCTYCFARPTHAYLGLSPGLDFETRLYAKHNAAERLDAELRKRGYQPALLALGANTDPYQPIEREYGITRSVLEVLERFGHPVGITTKSALVTRDIDILSRMAARGLARVFISVGTLDADIARKMEPRANTPSRRIDAIRKLTDAGIPTGVIVAPIVPALTDFDIERVLTTAAEAGATYAAYVMLRLPREVHDVFVEWLEANYPLRARHVMSLIEQVRDGKHNSSEFGTRMKGTGLHAELIRQRFHLAARKLGLNQARPPLRNDQFCVPELPPQASDRNGPNSGHHARPDRQTANSGPATAADPQMHLF